MDSTSSRSESSRRRGELFTFLKDPRVIVALPILALMVVFAFFAGSISPYDPNEQRLLENLSAPSLHSIEAGEPPHLAGTDHLGRDVFSRTVHGSRLSLLIGLVASTLSMVIGVTIGLMAGYFGGAVSKVLIAMSDIQIAFPFLILAIAVIAAVGASATAVILTLAMWGWVPFAKLVRGEVLVQKSKQYVTAARSIGGRPSRIMVRHILLNISSAILVQLTFFVGIVIVSEGALSFLGLGVQPPDPSWGRMMSDGRARLTNAWWMAVTPGVALSATVLAVNLLGDALTDFFNPRTEGT